MDQYNKKLNLLECALQIAVNTHHGQVDKRGTPYIFHPLRVMERCCSLDTKIVAILHDVIDKVPNVFDELHRNDFPQYLIDALEAITKQDAESYAQFIERASHNELAREVKIADLLDNLDASRLSAVHNEDKDRINRYIMSLEQLRGDN